MIITAKDAFQRTIKHVVHCHQNYLAGISRYNLISSRYDLHCEAKNWDWAACTGCWLPNTLATFVTVSFLSYLFHSWHFSIKQNSYHIHIFIHPPFLLQSGFHTCTSFALFCHFIRIIFRWPWGVCAHAQSLTTALRFSILFPIANNIFLRFSIH